MAKPLHVLTVEDSEDDHELVLHALKRGGFDVTAVRVDSAEALQHAIIQSTWDAIISDYNLPGFDGMVALELFKKSGRDVPFIVVSGRDDITRSMLKAGAHDCLHKSSLSQLAPVVERELGEAEQRRLRKLAEAKLMETQQHLHQALDASGLGAFNWDMTSDSTWRSSRYDQILGKEDSTSPSDFDSFLRQVVDEDRDEVRSKIAEIAITGHFAVECRIARPDGNFAHVALRGEILHNELGRPNRIVGTIADITLQKETEARVREQDELIRLLLDSTAEAIFAVDLEGNCTLANPACARILGYSSVDELKGRHIHSLIHSKRPDGSSYPEQECRVNQAFRTGVGTYVTDEVFWRADGSFVEAEYFSSPLRRNGEVVGAVVTFLDVSKRRELESRLRQAQKMEAIGQLAGGVAHDFNNILAVILMQAGLLQDDPRLAPELSDPVIGISRAAERAANLTRQLLLFSRKQDMEMRDCELNEITRNLTAMLERIISANIRIQFKWSSEHLFVKADPGMMDQILMNLVVNARDSMPEGGQLIVETYSKELDDLMAAQMPSGRSGSFVCLSVTDTGCGIPAEHLTRIFEPFFTTKEPEKGTGLGLSTVFGIVKQHSGWVHVISRVGFGSTFLVFLPRLEKSPLLEKVPETARPSRGNETILLVEDDPSVSESIRCILEQLGYRVYNASNGLEALDAWRTYQNEIDLVLTDLILPDEMRGEELARQLLLEKPSLKVVFTSGYAKEAAQTDVALRDGMNFLSKPYSPARLSEILRRNLDKPNL